MPTSCAVDAVTKNTVPVCAIVGGVEACMWSARARASASVNEHGLTQPDWPSVAHNYGIAMAACAAGLHKWHVTHRRRAALSPMTRAP